MSECRLTICRSLVVTVALLLCSCGVRSVAELRPAADAGDVSAQTELAACYAKGRGIARDPIQAAA